MTRLIVILSALGLLFAGGLLAFGGPAVVVADAVHGSTTRVGPSFPRHQRITCDTTAGGVEIKPTGSYQLVSYECTARGAVAVGSTSGTGAALTFATGVEYASGDRFGANVALPERCISAGSVVIECRFLVAAP
jgi:hypothetical protein